MIEKTSADKAADPRPGLLAGVRVVELAHFVFGPAAAAVLADWGAEVIKIEHPVTGDPSRGVAVYGLEPGPEGLSCLFDTFNRGKRGVAVDVSTDAGREVVLQLVERADVFLTSFLPHVREKLGLDAAAVRERNPRIIYASASGQGPSGEEAGLPGFDLSSYWYRSGLSAGATPQSFPYALGLPSPGFGDTVSGMALAGVVAAALLRRERTGEGDLVDVSLLQAGLFANQAAFAATDLFSLDELPPADRSWVSNPLVNVYRTADGRFVALSMLQSDKYWPGFCEAIGRADLLTDPRLAGAADRSENKEYCVSVLDEIFAGASLAEWVDRLAAQDGPWTVVKTASEAKRDPQALANGYVAPLRHRSGREVTVVPAPGSVRAPAEPMGAAPDFGGDTDEVLQELGLDIDQVLELKLEGVVG